MQVNEVTSEGLKREYKVVVDAASIEAATEGKLKAMGSRVRIAGFRPGHVPLPVLKQRYGKSVMGEVLEETVRHSSQSVLRDKGLRPALQPKIQIDDYKEGGSLAFTMTLEILPQMPEMDFSAIELERLVFDIEDASIEEGITRLAKRNRNLNPVRDGAKAKNSDVVVIDFKGSVDGVFFEGGEAKKFQLELGSGQFIPGFEDQLIGVKKGDETTVTVTFPETYHKADLAGKEAKFAITVHDVLESAEPEINDTFAQGFGLKDLADLRQKVREQLEKDYGVLARSRLKKQLFDHLEERCLFDVPKGMVEMEFNSIWQNLLQAKQEGDPALDRPEDELREEYQRVAERRVRLGILLAEVGNANKLQVTQEEITRAVMEQARMFPGQEKKVFEFYRSNPAQIDDLRGPILEEKAVDFIIGKATMKDRKITTAELEREEFGGDDTDAQSGEAKKTAKTKSASSSGAKKKKTEA